MHKSPTRPRRSLIAAAALAAIGSTPAQAANVSWIGPNGSFWDLAANWSPGLPTAADDVLLGNFDTEVRSGSRTVQSLVGSGQLRLTGGSLGMTQASSIGSLSISAGNLGGAGNLTVAGALSITGAGGKGIGFLTLNAGNTTWSGNTGNGNNVLTLSGAGVFNSAGTFTDANLFNSNINAGGGGGTFNNAGTFNKESNTTTAIGAAFNNTGTVNVKAGLLLPGGGGTSSGTFAIASGAKLEFRNGVHTLNNVTTSGGGTLQISTENVGADASVSINGGTHTSLFLLSGSTLGGTDHLFQGAATWTGGAINGAAATTFGSTLAITGPNGKSLGGRALSAGNTTWSGNTGSNNTISISGGGSFTNTGTFSDANDFNSSIAVGGGGGSFNNNGSFNKQSNTTTSIGTVFNSTGTVNVNAGTMLMHGGGSSTGVFNIAAGAKLEYRNGSHTLDNVTTAGLGTLEISTENVGADASVAVNGGTHTTRFVLSGSTMRGSNHTFQGVAAWTGGTITGTAAQSTTFGNALTISGPLGKTLSGGRSVNAGNTTWSGNTGNGNNAINISGASVFNSSGTFSDVNAFDSAINRGNGGAAFNNLGTFNKQSNTTTAIGTAFNNTGTVNVNAGTMLMHGGGTSSGVFNIAAGAKLEYRNGDHVMNNVTTSGAGLFEISTENVGADAEVVVNGGTHTTPFLLSGSAMSGTDATFQGPVTWTGGTIGGAATTTFSNDVSITGPNLKTIVGSRTVVLGGTTTWSGNTANNNNAIRFWNGGRIDNRGTFNDANASASFLEHNVGAGNRFSNAGIYNKQSNTLTLVDLGVVFENSGTLNINAGTMRFDSGTLGPTGTVNVASGATFQHGAVSTVGRMVTAGNLALAGSTLTVHIDYDNANFGAGNAFNRRANVTSTGAATPRLIAAGDANQGLSGAGIANGNTSAPTILIGNVHVGANTFSYGIANTGSTGPSLRGAVQDAVNGGNISDNRLSGNGVQAGNWGPVAPGQSTSRDIVVTVATAGVYTPISGQAVSIVNNFENTRSQLLTITSASGAAAYNLAAGSATPTPVSITNQRVGGSASQLLTVANTAAAGVYSEALNASFSGTGGAATTNSGSIVSLIAGGSNSSAMSVGVNTASAGAKTGSATLAYVSDGTGSNGNSGLAPSSVGSQIINVSGNVYQLAAGQVNTAALNFGTVQVGQAVSQVLSISNVASGPAGFVEDLNASFGAASGTGAALISGTGSINALAAGASNGTAMTVNVDTSATGSINGAIAVNYVSAGSVGGVSNGLAAVAVGSSDFGVSGVIQSQGQIVNQALPVVNNASVNFGNVRIGSAAPSQAVSITNQATAAPQAALNASISGAGPVLAGGSVNLLDPGATNSSNLQVGMSTATAGAVNGNASIAFVSDASNIGNCAPNCQLNLASQNVAVSGAVYRLANPSITTGPISMAARVGDAAPSASIGVSNVSPDIYTERLNASIGAGPSGFTTSGTITGLAAGASSSALGVTLNAATAGNFGGQASIAFVSSGAGTTNAPDQSLAAQNVSLSGRVYTPAVAQVNTSVVNFGIVHKGDVVAAKNVSVSNAAAIAAPNDELRGRLGGASGPFTASGTLAGVAAQASDNTSLSVALNTANAGVFNGNATASFVSHNAEMSDLDLGTANIGLQAQVNNFAELALAKTAGAGSFSVQGRTYTLDFGRVVQGSPELDAMLSLTNVALGPADLLSGTFAVGPGAAFMVCEFDPFTGLVAGASVDNLHVSIYSTNLGDFTRTIVISSFGSNDSGYRGALADTTLVLSGSVVAVPEPGTYALMAGGLLALWLARRRKPATA